VSEVRRNDLVRETLATHELILWVKPDLVNVSADFLGVAVVEQLMPRLMLLDGNRYLVWYPVDLTIVAILRNRAAVMDVVRFGFRDILLDPFVTTEQ
jgi:hypothetical protein